MRLTQHYLNFLIKNSSTGFESDLLNKIVLTVTVGFAMLLIIIYLTISHLLYSQIVGFALYAAIGVMLFINCILLLKNKQVAFHGGIIITLSAIGLIYLLIYGGIHPFNSIIIAFFPLMVNLIAGPRKGLWINLAFLFIVALILFVPTETSGTSSYSVVNRIGLLLSYLMLMFVFHIIEAKRIKDSQAQEKTILDQKNALKLKEDYLANLSHQIRTPLNNIMVISSILESINMDEKQRDMIDTIQASTNNLVSIVNSISNISDIEIRERRKINLPFNLQTVISNTLKLFSAQNSGESHFNLKIDESIPKSLSGDPVKIKQIFLNIIESILKNKSSGKATIEIKVAKAKESNEIFEIIISIASSRPILLPTNEGNNFFITNDSSISTSTNQNYINLLDLQITQKLIESNDGNLSVHLSADSASISFSYLLNKTSLIDDVEQTPESSTIEKERTHSKVDLSNANILLVEDNLINQKIVVLSLKKLVKSIEIANNGKEALDKFGTSRYDLILMDIQMPIMNGIVTTKKIREIESSAGTHTPIIAITANALLGDKEECIAAGMDDYISKPFLIEVLIQKMKALL